MKVIKATSHSGFMCQDYGIDINESFAQGTREECLAEVKSDILYMSNDEDTKLIFIDGLNYEEDFDDSYTLDDYFEELDPQIVNITVRIEVDDIYNSIYETTYKIVA